MWTRAGNCEGTNSNQSEGGKLRKLTPGGLTGETNERTNANRKQMRGVENRGKTWEAKEREYRNTNAKSSKQHSDAPAPGRNQRICPLRER